MEGEMNNEWEPTRELQDRVMGLARKWSRDDPDYRDDLYQEAMLAIWLKGECESPLSHQTRTAQLAMIRARKLGKSVDGKLNRRCRQRHYTTCSLEGEVEVMGGQSFKALTPDPCQQVDEEVTDNITFRELLERLDYGEQLAAQMLLEGYRLHEVADEFGLDYRTASWAMRDMRAKLTPCLGVN
jgi:DNA-directed RNA polymerase specialized sigma24 family protein